MGCKDPGKKAECEKTCNLPNKCKTVKKDCVCLPQNKFLKKYQMLNTNNKDSFYEKKYKKYKMKYLDIKGGDSSMSNLLPSLRNLTLLHVD